MKNQWIHCPNCDHRLFFLRAGYGINLEIKCSSCKAIITIQDMEDRRNAKHANDQKTAKERV